MPEIADRGKLKESLDACPFAPGTTPPKKGPLDILLKHYDGFFGNWKLVSLSLVLAGIVLGYSVIAAPASMVSLPGSPDSWSIPFAFSPSHYDVKRSDRTPRFSDVTVHEGDLVLEGRDVLLIENRTLVLKGDILVKDMAKLVMINGELLVQHKTDIENPFSPLETCFYHHKISFKGSSTLQATDSMITSQNGEISIGFFGESQGSILDSDLSCVDIHGRDDASIEASGSSISQIILGGAASVEVFDCDIGWIGLAHDYTHGIWDECGVVVDQSRVRSLELEFKDDAHAIVSSPILGHHDFWNTYTNITREGSAFNVTLRDTYVLDQVLLTMLDGDMEVSDLSGRYMIYGLKGSLRVSDCVVDVVGAAGSTLVNNTVCNSLQFHDLGQNTIIDTKIGSVYYHGFKGNITYENVLISETSDLSGCDGYIGGTITQEKGLFKYAWLGIAGITRGFRVLVHDEGRAINKAELTLYDEDDALIWSGETNREGVADFSIRFVSYKSPMNHDTIERNFNEPLRLEAKIGDVKQEAVVTFGVSTPIVFDLDSKNVTVNEFGTENLKALSGSMIVFLLAGFSLHHTQHTARSKDEFDTHIR